MHRVHDLVQNKMKQFLGILLSLTLVLGLLPGMSLTANAAIPDGGTYIVYTANGTTATSTATAIPTGDNVVEITASNVPTAWENGKTYVVTENVSISTRITISGEVNLILCDGATLTASKGITVTGDNTLNIYAQSEGNNVGQLLIGGVDSCNAGIGGGNKTQGGTVAIHGGKINVKGGMQGAAGIGGGSGGNGGNITIYGGVINAIGGNYYSAGIGGGRPLESNSGNGGTVTIYGGTVTATGTTDGGAGIGGGAWGGCGGTVTINGGTVIATGGKDSMGIGGVCGQQQSQDPDPDLDQEVSLTPPKNGSLTVNNGLKVYGGDSANPTTKITQEKLSEVYNENYAETTVYQYMLVSLPPHTHNFTYSANGATITATCSADDCPLTDNKATLTIAPSSTGGYGASLSDDAAEFDVKDEDIEYSNENGATWSKTVPSTSGSYQARIKVTDNEKEYIATVSYGVNAITAAASDHGTVTVPEAAAPGTTVTIETTPDTRYELESLTVTKESGGTVEVTKDGNEGTFTMPAEAVTVSATFTAKPVTLTLSTTGNNGTSCTAKLLDSDYNPVDSLSKRAGEEFILSINKDENYSYQVSFNPAAAVSMRGFSVDEYKAYINSTNSESLNTYLYWVTMPDVGVGTVNMAVAFATAKTFTILYQPMGNSNPNEVWVKFGKHENGQDKLVTAKMSPDAKMGDVAVWSLKMSAAFNPDRIAFATSESAADSATTQQPATVSENAGWSDISGGQYLIVGGNAKTVIVAFTDDSSSANTGRDAAVIDIGKNAKYQIAICASGGNGSVTTPAAPTKTGYDFVVWRGYEGITTKDYAANTSISVTENMVFSAVWKPKSPNVKLNLNGGTGIDEEFTVSYNTTLPSLTPVKSGYSFAGWIVAKDVTEDGEVYTKGVPFDTATKITADLELTAQWKHVHAYRCIQIGAVSSLATKYGTYAPYLHIKICGCGDVDLEAHSLNSNGVCACGYGKSDATQASVTLDVSYVKQSGGTTTTMMEDLPENVAANSEVSVSAPGKWGSLTFSKWQYKAKGDTEWTDAGAYKMMSFVIPSNMEMRALYVNATTKPEVDMSATTYETKASDGNLYDSILFRMNYKLPDGYTYVDSGVRSGDNAGISYYELKERTATMDGEAKAITYSLAAVLTVLSGELTTFDTSETKQYYAKREDSVLAAGTGMTAELLGEYMYKSKPINIQDPPLYWNYKPNTKGQSGSINALTPVGFAQRNEQNHYIYAIAWLQYKKPDGTVETIWTDAMATTLNGVSSAGEVSKQGK